MTPLNPNWTELKKEAFAEFVPDEVLQYRYDEIANIKRWGDSHEMGRPIEVEIGSNYGRFLFGLARARRDTHFLGIELKSSLVNRVARRIEREGDTNCHTIHADARLAIPVLFEPNSIDAIYVLFPDPWWKKRHARRRILDDAFFQMAHTFLKPGGHVIMKTDVRPYFESVRDYLQESSLFTIIDNDAIPNRETWDLTNRERHCIENNVPFDLIAVQKR